MSTWTHERKETHKTTVNQIGLNLFTFSESFRRIRKKDKGCKFCRKPFVNDQYIHLAFTDKGNKLLCDDCANKAIGSGVSFVDRKVVPKEKLAEASEKYANKLYGNCGDSLES